MGKLLNKKKETFDFFSIVLERLKVAAVFILNKDGIILDINAGVENSLGYRHEDVVGKQFSILFIDEDRQKHKPENELEMVLREGSATDYNYILHKNGNFVWVHGESILIEDESGQPYIMKVVFDITGQKKLEESLQEKNGALERINKDLDTFVYTASHDLKAPISNIEALLFALYDELDETAKSNESIIELREMLSASIEKFKTTINDLSSVGKSLANQVDDITMISFKSILEDVKMNLQEVIDESEPMFVEDFSTAPEIHFSAKNLRSILQNLISNAIKYRSERIPEIKISSESINEQTILLKVSDNGLGIKKEDQEKIFSMYQRLHNHVEGTGVGMAIVKKIIDNNGGKIEVESEEGKGTTFKIYLKSDLGHRT